MQKRTIVMIAAAAVVVLVLALWDKWGSLWRKVSGSWMHQPKEQYTPDPAQAAVTRELTKSTAPPATACGVSKLDARSRVQTLWGQHGNRTRIFALRYLNDHPGQQRALDELLDNQKALAVFLDEMTPGEYDRALKALKKHSIEDLVPLLDDIRRGNDHTDSAKRWLESTKGVADVHAKALGADRRQLEELLRGHDAHSLKIWLLHVEGLHSEEAPAVQRNLNRLRSMADAMVSNVQCGLSTRAYAGE